MNIELAKKYLRVAGKGPSEAVKQFLQQFSAEYARALGQQKDVFESKFRKAFDLDSYESEVAEVIAKTIPEPILAAAVAFYGSPDGTEFVKLRAQVEQALVVPYAERLRNVLVKIGNGQV